MKLDKVIAERKNKTVYRDGNLAIKVFSNEYSKADILNEACNQARVEDCGLNIPRVREVCKIDGKWAIATEYVEGVTLQKMMDDHPEKIDEYLNLFVDLQMQIHAKKVPHLNKLKEKMQRKISETTLDATPVMSFIQDSLLFPSTIRYVTAISFLQTLLLHLTIKPTSSTGHM